MSPVLELLASLLTATSSAQDGLWSLREASASELGWDSHSHGNPGCPHMPRNSFPRFSHFASVFLGEYEHSRWIGEGCPAVPSSQRPTGSSKHAEKGPMWLFIRPQLNPLCKRLLEVLSFHFKTVLVESDLYALGSLLSSHPLTYMHSISSILKNVKEFYNSQIRSSPPPPCKSNETGGGKTNGEIYENSWLRLVLQTETGNLSELKLPYKVSLHTRRDDTNELLGLNFLSFLPWNPFPSFYPIVLTL